MATEQATNGDDALQAKLLHALIQRRGLKESDYVPFFVTGEGDFSPGGSSGDIVEAASGYVLDKHGRVFYFWLGCDPNGQELALTEWREVEPEPHWSVNTEYRRARKRLGLAP